MMPVLFLGHGNPMNAVSKNAYTEAWAALGKSVPCPTAVLGARRPGEPVIFPVDGVDGGSVSVLAVRVG